MNMRNVFILSPLAAGISRGAETDLTIATTRWRDITCNKEARLLIEQNNQTLSCVMCFQRARLNCFNI